ncbi:MAG: DUF427 domain-containing protein [Rhodospirillales bacterium]|nr:DUF427 domain-containing protein [Rhodospirillales bacterium]
MARAVWNGVEIAASQDVELLEGNVYFPAATLRMGHLRPSPHTSVCPWKGTAHYYDVVVDGKVNAAAAWFYPDPRPKAARIKGHVAFWKGVSVETQE